MSGRESFLVRIWFDEGCVPSQVRGEIQHVRTGQSRRFCGEQELLRVLHAWTRLMQEGRDDTDLFQVDIQEEDPPWNPS